MTALILQTALLMVGAYLLGAVLATLVRRAMAAEPAMDEARPSSMWIPKTAEPVPSAVPTVGREAVAGAPIAAEARRFERALSGSAVAQPAPPRPAPAAPVTPQPPAAAAQVATEQIPVAVTAAAQAATAAAAAAAATAVTAQRSASAQPPGRLPSATGSSGPAMVSAQVSMSPAPLAADDLTKIRAIDTVMRQRLAGIGVTRFQQIADWRSADVQKVAGALGLKGRIQQENWIEQAQILARGGQTAFARQPQSGAALATPTRDEGEHRTLRGPAPSAPMPAVAPPPAAAVVQPPKVEERAAFARQMAAPAAAAAQPSASAAVAAAAAAAVVARAGAAAPTTTATATRSAPAAPVPGAVVSAAPRPSPPTGVPSSPPGPQAAAAAAAAAVATAAQAVTRPPMAQATTTSTPQPASPPAQSGSATQRPAAAPAPAGAAPPAGFGQPPRPPIGTSRDNLQRVRGINAEVEKLLNVQGVTRFGQIAGWSPVDVQRFDGLLGYEGRIGREKWIEQAQILARHGDTQQPQVRPAAPASPPSQPSAASTGSVPVVPRPAQAPAFGQPVAAAPVAAGPRPAQVPGAGTASAVTTGATLPAAPPSSAAPPVAPATASPAAPAQGTTGSVPIVPAAAPVAEPPRAARPAEATKAQDATGDAGSAAQAPASRQDLSGLRSVRSEAYRGSDPAEATRRAGANDDLKRIRGIGVLIEKKLTAMGVTSYGQIASWSAGDIDKVSAMLDFKGRIERENWVEQARILASGGQTEFSRRVDKGEIDSSRNKP